MNIILLFGFAVFLISGSVMLFCYKAVKSKLHDMHGTLQTTGTVIDLSESPDSDNETVYSPRIEFTISSGHKTIFTSETYFRPSPYAKGDTVIIRYNPDNPEKALLNNFFAQWGAIIIICTRSCIFLFFGFYIILIAIRVF